MWFCESGEEVFVVCVDWFLWWVNLRIKWVEEVGEIKGSIVLDWDDEYFLIVEYGVGEVYFYEFEIG